MPKGRKGAVVGAQPPEKRPPGRPSATPEAIEARWPVVEAVLEGIRKGDSLRASCAAHGVNPPTFLLWVGKNEPAGLGEQYALAREIGTDVQAEGINELAAEARLIVLGVGETAGVDPKLANSLVQAIRLQVDTLKWTLAKRNPGRYGEKMDLTSGGKPLEPQTIVIAGKEITF